MQSILRNGLDRAFGPDTAPDDHAAPHSNIRGATITVEENPTMLSDPTTERLHELGLIGMARALEEQRRQPDSHNLGFKDRLAMLVDRKALERDTKRLAARLRLVGLREPTTPEDDRPMPKRRSLVSRNSGSIVHLLA